MGGRCEGGECAQECGTLRDMSTSAGKLENRGTIKFLQELNAFGEQGLVLRHCGSDERWMNVEPRDSLLCCAS